MNTFRRSFMAKKSSKSESGCAVLVAIIIFIVTAIFSIFSNLTNLPIAYTYSPGQYFRNIINLHSDELIETKKPLKLYKEINELSNLNSKDVLADLKPGTRLRFKGRKSLDNVTWLAVKAFRRNEPLYGYVLVEESMDFPLVAALGDFPKSNSVQVPSGEEISKLNKSLWNIYENAVRKEVKVQKITGAINIQKLKESKQFKIINPLSDDTTVYYCDSQNYNKTLQIYNEYLGTNYDTQLLQIEAEYKATSDGIYTSSAMYRFLKNPITRFAEIILIFIFLARIFHVSNKCPKCSSKKIEISTKRTLGQFYKHQRKDGNPDGRYKDNPLMNKVEELWVCSDCQNEWKDVYAERN